ncbi:CAP domain-containing protein [Mycena vulgaris]|nr:CAP domain-containing protein [Mycena vulgaris]
MYLSNIAKLSCTLLLSFLPLALSMPAGDIHGSVRRTSAADEQAYLKGHNSIRAQHGAKPLTWSDNAAAKAQQWANGCVFKHSGGTLGPFGENLAAGTGDFSIAAAVKAWTDEVSEYNPSNPQPSHFTQVVWKGTTQVGCAVATCDNIFPGFGPAQFYVCEYSPAGNVIGQFPANVQV